MSEQEPKRQLTEAQEQALGGICARYEVEYDASHYFIYPADSIIMPLWAEGWVGGPQHANPQYGQPTAPPLKPTIYVGVSPKGDIHS